MRRDRAVRKRRPFQRELMSDTVLPIVILAGSDGRPAELPAEGRDRHPLSGYKGADVRIAGRPLIEASIGRLAASGVFDPIYVVGPASRYASLGSRAVVVDADGPVGENLRAGLEAVQRAHPGRSMALTTCDVLPDRGALRSAIEDYARHAPCALWCGLVRVPADRARLGVSTWKPTYRIRVDGGAPPVPFLPGHLAIVDPAALRLSFVYRVIQVGYRTRNRSIGARRGEMVRGVLFELLAQDLRNLIALRVPTLTWSVLAAGIGAAAGLKAGTITLAGLERALERILVSRRYRRRHAGRAVRVPLIDALSLALDIDTEEEAAAAGGEFTAGTG
jgi:hypothetical protein